MHLDLDRIAEADDRDVHSLRAGVLDGKPLTAEEISALATLPPREVILAQLLGLLQAPATQLARLLNEPGSSVARVLDAIAKKAAAAAPAESAPAEPAEAPKTEASSDEGGAPPEGETAPG